ncbi:MAG: thioredoxin family protein [Planctomycetes bacterium]|nr:thioredoxin family protein [Planctomycetota bacterium]
MIVTLFLCVLVQDPARRAATVDPASASLSVVLVPAKEGDRGGPRWSPKAASVPLTTRDGALHGSFFLGSKAVTNTKVSPSTDLSERTGAPPFRVSLSRSEGAAHVDMLWIDLDRDGEESPAERLHAEPKETRGKWWSSFQATLSLPTSKGGVRSYPIALWYVEDPREPDAAPALRWTRRGWHAGKLTIGDQPAYVSITERVMDGVFDQRDCWAIARSVDALTRAPSRSMEGHVWLDGVAYRALSIDSDGSAMTFEAFDPGFTEAEEKERADTTKPDREAPRAAAPLAFGKDFAAALAEAKRDGKQLFVDFETTWCGPCKAMDQWVYTAADVVDAGKGFVAVKLDGDEERDLVKKYGVGGYPTMLVLDADGKVLRRAVGYRGVKAMAAWLRN